MSLSPHPGRSRQEQESYRVSERPTGNFPRRRLELRMNLSNYLFFTTTCERALDFYTECGLGRVVSAVRHGDNGMPVRTESMRGKIMHSLFEGPGVRFFASDNDDAEPMRGFAM